MAVSSVEGNPESSAAPSSVQRWRQIAPLAIPVLAWALGNLVHWIAAARHGYDYFDPGSRSRWDSAHYLSIAEHGYGMGFGEPVGERGITVAGNVGWFPMYSGLIRLVQVLGFDYQVSAVLVTELAGLAMIVLLWWFLRDREGSAKYVLMALAAVFPASVYSHAIFPMSTVVAAVLGGLLILTRGTFSWPRVVAAGLCGTVAAAAYPVGIVIAPALVVCVIGQGERAWRRWVPPAAVLTGLTALGAVAVGLLMEAQVGRWDAYFVVMDQFGAGLGNPVAVFSDIVESGHVPFSARAVVDGRSALPESWPALELIFAFELVVLALVGFSIGRVRRRSASFDVAVLIFTVLAFTMPLTAGSIVSQYRPHTLLLPALILLRHLDPMILLPLLPVSLIIAYHLAALFYASYLV